MAISNAKTDILGINRSAAGGVCEVIKDSSGNVLNNVLEAWKFMDKDGVQAQLVTLYHPELTVGASAGAVSGGVSPMNTTVVGAGYINFAIGSKIKASNGFVVKLGAPGIDTWKNVLGA